ncbi:hypothetical protein DCAR_0102709 [Daucus carota subsp. sativus]|uniref:Pentacotripeptide-repeat region of PRORP domain-containing protein n=1 Tax=Daucus carota subsp. sativus TaxID=79200 RepID=A0AAF1AIA4_DAUCS|nr:hypothetical protein DCAR_0102709 [Daucus carota subsp. sativus]
MLKNQSLLTFLDECKSLSQLKQIHAQLIATGLTQFPPFASRILSFTATSNSCDIEYSYKFFLQLSSPTIFNYNTIIRGYSNSRNPNKGICVFVDMLRNGVDPDYLTYPFVVKALARLSEFEVGLGVHCRIMKTGFLSDKFVGNSLIHLYGSCGKVKCARKVFEGMIDKNRVSWNCMLDGYAKCGDVVSAREVFEVMPERDVVSWSSLIDGYVKKGEYSEALAVFERMQVLGVKGNEVTLVSVLCACAHMGALEKGRTMNMYIIENGLPLTLVLRTSLVDMYAKCGAIEDALAVFRGVLGRQTDVLIWNAMIGGFATHGFDKESFDMFTEMKIAGVTPDEITYLCMLSACAHGGLVKEAWCFFEILGKDGLKPKTEHYACMVDVLARAGQVDEAYQFLCQMPMQPTASMLGALLSGCINNRKLDLAEIVGKWLIELEPDHDGRYVGLSNVYAVIKRWEEARAMREVMEKRGVKKSPGYSFVEIFGTLHKFIAHDKTHAMSEQIYMMLSILLEQMTSNADSVTDASLCGPEYVSACFQNLI